MAMQFGLALAGAETLRKFGKRPQLAIVLIDKSDHMQLIGKQMWSHFIQEVADTDKHPKLRDLLQVCTTMKMRSRPRRTEETCWLTALHVAYEKNFDAVKDELDAEVRTGEPDIVLVTTHPMADDWAYAPYDRAAYQKYQKVLSADDLAPFNGNLEATTRFRRNLYDSYKDTIDHIADSQGENKISHFLSRPVSWNPSNFESARFLYLRR